MSTDGLTEPARLHGGAMAALNDAPAAVAAILDVYKCATPGYGAPGFDHCAACCYGSGFRIECAEDQSIVDAALALQRALTFPHALAEGGAS